MKKSKIVLIVVAILIIAIIVALMLRNKGTKNNENIIETEPETFGAKVIAVEEDNITVVADENAAISSTARVVKIRINEKTQLIKEGAAVSKDNIEKDMDIKISFDGKLMSTAPLIIIADKIEM